MKRAGQSVEKRWGRKGGTLKTIRPPQGRHAPKPDQKRQCMPDADCSLCSPLAEAERCTYHRLREKLHSQAEEISP